MRILFISNLYPPHDLGGMEQLCQETVERMRERGHACHVLTSRYGVDSREPPEPDVTRAFYLQAGIHYYRPLDFFLRRPGQERANRDALRQIIDSFRPDIVFIWGMWNLTLRVAFWAEQWLPGRVAYAVADYRFVQIDPHESYWTRPALHRAAKVVMAPAQRLALRTLVQERAAYPLGLEHVACVSDYVRNKLSQAGVLPHGARVIYNGIDPFPFLHAAALHRVDAKRLRLVYTGSLVQQKGVHTAIEALGLLRQSDGANSFSLTIVGGGHPDYERQLRQRITELDLDTQVNLLGRVPRAQIAEILSSFDVFLFTSIWEEPIARSVMEAMAAGLVVIGTPVGGQSEMLEDNVNALVFPPDDTNKLAECILRLQHDQALRKRLSETGRRMILEHFTLDRMADEIEEWLSTIARQEYP